jgi:predicted acetyltransferase
MGSSSTSRRRRQSSLRRSGEHTPLSGVETAWTMAAGGRYRMAMTVRLRPLLPGDEEPFRAAHEAMRADGFEFGLGLDGAASWTGYLDMHRAARRGRDLPPGRVPATFLVADVDGEIVGRTSIRHELNEFLAREGGHIGYGVLHPYRRRGYATEILAQSLVIARAEGIDRVLVTCAEDNLGSIEVIERCGGRFDSVIDGDDGVRTRRYWIS